MCQIGIIAVAWYPYSVPFSALSGFQCFWHPQRTISITPPCSSQFLERITVRQRSLPGMPTIPHLMQEGQPLSLWWPSWATWVVFYPFGFSEYFRLLHGICLLHKFFCPFRCLCWRFLFSTPFFFGIRTERKPKFVLHHQLWRRNRVSVTSLLGTSIICNWIIWNLLQSRKSVEFYTQQACARIYTGIFLVMHACTPEKGNRQMAYKNRLGLQGVLNLLMSGREKTKLVCFLKLYSRLQSIKLS